MDIKYEVIESKYIGRYADLALEEQLQRAKYKSVTTAAAFMNDDGRKRAVGLIQFARRKNNAELLWIYVDSGLRGRGIGKGLIKYLFDSAFNDSASKICVRIPEDMRTDYDAVQISDYLLNNGFSGKETVPGPWLLTGKDVFLENFRLGKKNLDALFKIITPFDECTPSVIGGCADALKISDKDSVLNADKHVSFLYESGGTYKGMIWANKIGDTLYPGEVVFKDESVRDRLLAAFFYGFSRNIYYADRIVVENTEISREWIPKFFPDMGTKEAILLTADAAGA